MKPVLRHALALFLLLVLTAPFVTAASGLSNRRSQTFSGGEILDEDYAFSLRRPGSGWRLMAEGEAERLAPDAVAGAVNSSTGMTCLLFITPLPEPAVFTEGIDAAALRGAEIIASAAMSAAVSDIDPGEWKSFSSQDYYGVEFVGLGRHDGELRRIVVRSIPRQGWEYRFVGWGSAPNTRIDGSDFHPVFKALGFLPGGVRLVNLTRPLAPDEAGPGWRLEAGRLRNTLFGFAANPPPASPWRVASSSVARTVDPEAQLLLEAGESLKPRVSLRAARIPRHSGEAFIAAERSRLFAGAVPVSETSGLTLRFLGSFLPASFFPGKIPGEVRFFAETAREGIIWFLHGTLPADSVARENFSSTEKSLNEAVEAIELLKGAAEEEWSEEDERLLLSRNEVGPAASLRGGVYRDFHHDFLWRKPRGPWFATLGEAARRMGEGRLLEARNPRLGATLLLSSEAAYRAMPLQHHANVIAAWKDRGALPLTQSPVATRFGSAPGLVTEFRIVEDGVVKKGALATAIAGDFAAVLVVMAPLGEYDAALPEISSALRGLSLIESLESERFTRDRIFRDERLGFSFTGARPQWRPRDLTPTDGKRQGTVLSLGDSSAEIIIAAVADASAGEERVRSLLESLARERLPAAPDFLPSRFGAILGGLPASAFRAGLEPDAPLLITARRDATWFGVLLLGYSHPHPAFDELAAGFAFLR